MKLNSIEIQIMKNLRKRKRTGWVLSEYPLYYSTLISPPPSGLRPCTGKIKIIITIFNPNNLHCSLHISSGTDNESLFDNQELPKLVIIAFILVTFIIWSKGDTARRNKEQFIVRDKGINSRLQ